jgi:hypothetical protein
MTIATNADLLAQIAAFANRANLTTQIPYFVQLCETRIYYGSREPNFTTDPLRIRAMEQSSYTSFNAQKIALPSDFLASRRLYIDTAGGSEIAFMPPDQFWKRYLNSTSSVPKSYTVEGENIVLGPAPDSAYTGRLLYYKKFTALSAGTDTNWILANSPGIYLSGSLAELFRYARNMDQATAHLATFSGLVNALNVADKSDRYASPWAAVSDTGNP